MKQCDKLLAMLGRGPVTAMDCIRAGIINYRGRVSDLRKLGFPVEKKMVTEKDANGEKKTFARYYLA